MNNLSYEFELQLTIPSYKPFIDPTERYHINGHDEYMAEKLSLNQGFKSEIQIWFA